MKKTRTRALVLSAMCAALTAVVAPFTIFIGPVGVTLSVFAVLFTGALLPPGRAAAAMLVYLAIGMVGLPVFSGFQSGPQVLAGPTGGYLAAYPLMAFVMAAVCRRTSALLPRVAGMVLALAVCYVPGTAWFMVVSGSSLSGALALCVLPFVVPDLVKGVCALLLARSLEQRMEKAGL